MAGADEIVERIACPKQIDEVLHQFFDFIMFIIIYSL
jgi:hypothetical protein